MLAQLFFKSHANGNKIELSQATVMRDTGGKFSPGRSVKELATAKRQEGDSQNHDVGTNFPDQ